MMPYFDDNEDYIIYGSHSAQEERHLMRLMNREAKEMKTTESEDRWLMADGKVMLVKNATSRHLYNARAKFKREGRAARLCLNITIELDRRHAAGEE